MLRPPHAVASFLRVSDHTIERISHESWSLIPVALTFAAGALAQAPQERPDWKLFFSIRRSMERLSLRTSVLARCWLTMWNVHRTVHAGIDFKVPHACLRSMPERSVTSSSDSVGWRETGL